MNLNKNLRNNEAYRNFQKIFLFIGKKHPWCIDKYTKIGLQNLFDGRYDGIRINATLVLQHL